MGLRAMYFLLADFADRFAFLKYGLAVILIFIGTKMLIAHYYEISTGLSLFVVLGLIALSIIASLAIPEKESVN